MRGKKKRERRNSNCKVALLLNWHGYIKEQQLIGFHDGIKVGSRELAHFEQSIRM